MRPAGCWLLRRRPRRGLRRRRLLLRSRTLRRCGLAGRRLRLGLRRGLGLRPLRLCPHDLGGLRRRLIALHQFGRHALRHARDAPGNIGLRSPGSGFLVLNQLSGSKLSQPDSASPRRSSEAVNQSTIRRTAHRVPQLFLSAVGQRQQHLDLAARAGRRLGIGEDHVGPSPHRRRVVGAPGREREHRARAVAERRDPAPSAAPAVA